MISIEAKLEDADKTRLLAAIAEVDKAVHFYAEEAPRKLALAYVKELRANIISGRYDAAFAAYNPKYAKWKASMGLGSKFWKLYGDLIMNLRVFKDTTDGYWGGIPYGLMDRGGKSWFSKPGQRVGPRKPIAMYGTVVEEGNKKTPARPVFALTFRDFTWSKTVATQGGMWIEGEKVLQIIGGKWK